MWSLLYTAYLVKLKEIETAGRMYEERHKYISTKENTDTDSEYL